MNDEYVEQLGTKLGEFCGQNPDATLWDVLSSFNEE